MASCTDCGIGRIETGPNAGAFYLKGASSASWSRACSIEDYNGLHCDPLTGNAWAEPPIGAAGVDSVTNDNYPPASVVAGLAVTPVRTVRFNNPSQCLPFVGYMTLQFGYGMTSTLDFEVDVAQFISFAVNAVAPAPILQDTHTVVGSIATGVRTVWSDHSLPDWFSPITIPPGGFVEFSSQMVVSSVRYIGPPGAVVWAVGGSAIIMKVKGSNTQI
jgi:hypothetical protein